jgi:nicotinate-nucleotide adenylyltransferase
VAAARQIVRHPRIVVTGFEAGRASLYTIDTLRFLKRRFPDVNFVWLMGADNLISFHRWRAWEELFELVPIAVLDRPGFRLKARASKAAQRFAFAALDESDAGGLARMVPPAWTVLSLPLSGASSTALRGGKSRGAKAAWCQGRQRPGPQGGKGREKGGQGTSCQGGENDEEGGQASQEAC